jgi:hypothetical protein
VIVKARLYLGASYDASPKKAEAYKQGKLTELDRVETKAKARAARDFGIGTEHALDMDDLEAGSVEGSAEPTNGNGLRVVNADKMPQETNVDDLKALCVEVLGNGKWQAMRVAVLGEEVGDIPDEMLSAQQKAKIYGALVARKKKQAQKAS